MGNREGPQAVITEPGVYDLPDREYLADPVVEPSLNNSIGQLLVDLSPAHAYAAHPRLGGAGNRLATDEMNIGTAAHALFLRGEDIAAFIEFDDWRKNAAKEARDAALAAGKVPLLTKHYDATQRVVDALQKFRQHTGAFTNGKPEQTIVWREGPSWCRCKVDWLPDDPAAELWDLKTTGGNATARTWGRSAFDHGFDMQAAWYPRGAECVRGEPPKGMLFCVIETDPPFGIRVFGLSPPGLDVAEGKVTEALRLWQDCRRSGDWPNYGIEPEWIDPPPWILKEWEARQWERRRGMQPISEPIKAVVQRMIQSGNLAG